MKTQTSSWLKRGLLLAAGAIVVLAAACGGSDDKKSTTNSNDSSSSSSPASTATSGGASSGTITPGGGSSGGLKTAALSSLDSYRYTLKMEGTGTGGPLADLRDSMGSIPGGSTPKANEAVSFKVDGAFVKPDKATWKINLGSFEVAQTVIGKQEWVTFGGQTMGPQPASSLDPNDLSLAAAMWDQSNLPEDVSSKMSCASGKENVNGVSARKCDIDKAALSSMQKDLQGFFEDVSLKDLSAFNMSLWLADQGYPVKLNVEMAGKDSSSRDYGLKMQMDLTDVNKSIDIKEPTASGSAATPTSKR